MRREMAPKPGKRRMTILSPCEKVLAIQRVNEGESKASVARNTGIPESTLRGWIKSENKIRILARKHSSTPDSEADSPDSEADSPASSSGANPLMGGASNHAKRMRVHDGYDAVSSEAAKQQQQQHISLANGMDYINNLMAHSLVANGIWPENMPSLIHPLSQLASAQIGVAAAALMDTPVPVTPRRSNDHSSIGSSAGALDLRLQSQIQQQQQQQQQAQAQSSSATRRSRRDTHNGVSSSTGCGSDQIPRRPDDAVLLYLAARQQFLNGGRAISYTGDQSWFWHWYKHMAFNGGVTPSPSSSTGAQQQQQPNSTNSNVTVSPTKARAVLDSIMLNNNNESARRSLNSLSNGSLEDENAESHKSVSLPEAMNGGEKLLEWLNACSHPSVSSLQILQLQVLLDSIKRSPTTPSKTTKHSRK